MTMQSLRDVPTLTSDGEPEQRHASGYWKVCLIRLGGERFAVDLRQVREVFKLESMTPVPGTSELLIGVANLRGVIVPLVDLRSCVGASRSTTPHYALVVRHGVQQIGIVIDDVPEIRTIQADDLLSSSDHVVREGASLLSCVFRTDGTVSGLFETSRLLAMVEGTTSGGKS